MKNYDVKTYTKEERRARATDIAINMEDMLHYHYDEIAGDEPKMVKKITFAILARRLLTEAQTLEG